jgi:hypothetical protein
MKFEIVEVPWKHLIVDDFLSDEEYEKILVYIKSVYDFSKKCGYKEIHKHNSDSVISNIFCPKILSIKDLYFDELNYGNKELPEIYYPFIELVVSPPGFKYFKIHTDDAFKLMTTVCYFYPDFSTGTELYTTDKKTSYHHSVEWNKNRALSFVSQEKNEYQKTWHNYFNNTEDIRITFNLILSTHENGKNS